MKTNKEIMEKIIVVLLKNYKKTAIACQTIGSRRIMVSRKNLGCYSTIKAFYHFNFDDESISSSFWSNGTWNHFEIKL